MQKLLIFFLLCFIALSVNSQAPDFSVTGSLPGKEIFLAPLNYYWNDYDRYAMIVDGGTGSMLNYTYLKGSDCAGLGSFCNIIFDFRPLSSGGASYIQKGAPSGYQIKILDNTLTIADSFDVPGLDPHELYIDNGLIYLITEYDTTIDLSGYTFPFGAGSASQSCLFYNAVILDSSSKAKVYEWNSINLPLSGMDTEYSGNPSEVSPVHMNSFKPIEGIPGWDYVLSNRHRNDVIVLQDTNVKFIIGGINSDFSFVGDTSGLGAFSGQHDAIIYEEGGTVILSLFDNGNRQPFTESRGVKYVLDTLALTATLIREWRHPADLYSSGMGGLQLLDDGGAMVCWGSAGPFYNQPLYSVYDSAGTIATELTMDSLGYACYRAYVRPKTILTQLDEAKSSYPTRPVYYDFITLTRIELPEGANICEVVTDQRLFIEVINGKGRLRRCIY